MAIALIVAALAIAIILLAAECPSGHCTTTTDRPTISNERGTATATTRTTKDNFKVQVPQGWVMHDIRNTGSALVAEVLEGFGILAQLCPEQQPQQQQQQVALPNAAGGNTSNSNSNNNSTTSTNRNSVKALKK